MNVTLPELKKPPKNKIAKKWIRREKKHSKIFKDPGQSRFFESIKVPVEICDTILMGRFKNKKVVVKSIDYNDKGVSGYQDGTIVYELIENRDYLY